MTPENKGIQENLLPFNGNFLDSQGNIKNIGDISAGKGEKGDMGPPGPPGPQGEKGDKGDPGTSENVPVKATTKPVIAGVSAIGVLDTYAAADHIHDSEEKNIIKSFGTYKHSQTSTTCTLSTLPATIAQQSKFINTFHTITVSGDGHLDAYLTLDGFFGPGSLTVTFTGTITMNGISVRGCNLTHVLIENLSTPATGISTFQTISLPQVSNYSRASVAVCKCTGTVEFNNIFLGTPSSASSSCAGFYVNEASCIFRKCKAQGRGVGFLGFRDANLIVRSIKDPGTHNLSYAFKLYSGSTLTWPGSSSTLTGQTGNANYTIASASTVFFSGTGAAITAAGFSDGEVE